MIAKDNKYPVETLLIRLLENAITDKEIESLNQWMAGDPKSVRKYCSFLKDYAIIQSQIASEVSQEDDLDDKGFNAAMWNAFLEIEKTAPEIEISIPKESREPAMKPLRVSRTRRISKFSLYTTVISTAALLFLLIFIRLAPTRIGTEVATLSDLKDVTWADSKLSLQKGDRLLTNQEPLRLAKGLIEIQTDRSVTVTIEGPAEFEIIKDADLYLSYGRLYAQVAPKGVGFTVSTANSKVVDLGTEFGIIADPERTELHVMRGKTVLIPGSGENRTNQYEVRRGQAKVAVHEIRQGQAKVVIRDGTVKDILLKKDAFVREFNSENHFVWKGQNLDLADIVGGGNGFGTGRGDTGIDYTGKTVVLNKFTSQKGPAGYVPVPSNSFIDGMFIPDGGNGPVVTSSQGHLFKQCPDTNGKYWGGILNRPQHKSSQQEIPWHNLRLGSKTYDGKQNKAIYMHANQGITFDLKTIHQMMPDKSVSRFEATCGISSTLEDYKDQLRVFDYRSKKWTQIAPEITKADFYVLVDGQVRFSKIDITVLDGAINLFVDINPGDRFLTLVTTQGSNDIWGNSNDWTLFAEPVLIIEK